MWHKSGQKALACYAGALLVSCCISFMIAWNGLPAMVERVEGAQYRYALRRRVFCLTAHVTREYPRGCIKLSGFVLCEGPK